MPGEAVGSIILDRPVAPYLRAHVQEQASWLWQNWSMPTNPESTVRLEEFAAALAARLGVVPISVSRWSGMTETEDDEGQARFSLTASYSGDPTLWKFDPSVTPAARPLGAILTENAVTLQVRVPRGQRSDPEGTLSAMCDEPEDKLDRVRGLLEHFNAERHHGAQRYVRWSLSRDMKRQPMFKLVPPH